MFTFVFLLEAVVKLVGLGPSEYFKARMNIFDFVIVCASMGELGTCFQLVFACLPWSFFRRVLALSVVATALCNVHAYGLMYEGIGAGSTFGALACYMAPLQDSWETEKVRVLCVCERARERASERARGQAVQHGVERRVGMPRSERASASHRAVLDCSRAWD